MQQPTVHNENKNLQKDLTTLSDYDIFDLYIRSVQVFAEVSSRAGLENGQCFVLGSKLWKEAIKARDEYRSGHSNKDSAR